MKKFISTSLLFFLIILQSFSQTKVLVPNKVYSEMKAHGALKPGVNYVIINDKKSEVNEPHNTSPYNNIKKENNRLPTTCSCLVPVDGTFSVADFTNGTAPDYRNDDGSTLAKALPFTFCFYGTNYNSVFINNNGNITFVNSLFSFSAGGFPAGADTVMIAPFWADIDTRDLGSGFVHYKITPTYMIIKWDKVGYYNSHSDKLNDFQLIISNGTDPIIPNGNNVAFCYGDMQWTTGDASSGTTGFGGTAANAGINKGDGISFFQLGRFDLNSSLYDGPYGANDGINYLDNKSYYFTTCAPGNNIPPILSPYISLCDSFKICGLADTLVYLLSFSSPEVGQIVSSITASAPSLGSAFTILNVTTGQTGTILFRVIANAGVVGNHTINITATDNGTPAASTVINFNVPIILGVSPPEPQVSASPPVICSSGSSVFTLNNAALYDGYFWSTGVMGGPLTVSDSNVYYVTVNKNGCYKSTADSLTLSYSPTPTILGTNYTCGTTPTTLYIDSASLYTSYVWSNSSTNDSVNTMSGTFTVTVTGPNGCTGTSPPVTVLNSTLNITGTQLFCFGDSTLITANVTPPAGASYLWSNSATTAAQYVYTTGSYYVTVNAANGCILKDTLSVTATPVGVPVISFTYPSPVCKLGVNPSPSTVAGFTPGGTYSSSAGLSINSSTGLINLATSTAGTYTVTYTIVASACNPFGSGTSIITIKPPVTPVLGFSYSDACITDTNPVPATVPGFVAGGMFTSASGLSLNAVTGVINLAASTPGAYVVTYSVLIDTSLAVCMLAGTSTANIVIHPLPVVGISSDIPIFIGSNTTLIASGGVNYLWSPSIGLSCTSCDTTVASPIETQVYCVTVIDSSGCIDSSCVRVSVEIPCLSNRDLTVPNAFTPNGDGNNDELCLFGWDACISKFEINIFDRWGERVYNSQDPGFCWNGVYKGVQLDPAVFVYFINATFISSGAKATDPKDVFEITKKGNISLVR